MATISENLQIIKTSVEDIKQAIIDKGGTIEGDISTWADAISAIESAAESIPNTLVISQTGNDDNKKIYDFLKSLAISGFAEALTYRVNPSGVFFSDGGTYNGTLYADGTLSFIVDSGSTN